MNVPRPETPKPEPASAPTLASPVTCVWGVGSERAALLARLDIQTVGDLLLHRPRRYEDRRNFQPIRELEEGVPGTVRGKVVAMGTNRFKSGKFVFELIVDDGSARLHCRWWNLGFMERFFAVGDDVLVFGKLHTLRPRTMDHPETEKVLADDEEQVHLNRIVPVYPATEGLSQRVLRGLTWRALQAHAAEFADPHPELDLAAIHIHPTDDARGKQLALEARPLLPRAEAVRSLHFPAELTDADRARQRLAFDEFIGLQFEIQQRRLNFERNLRALPCTGDNRLMRPFLAELGFSLTGAQQRVLREIRADFGGKVPMRRLLQGDVGSGKTLVAACAALMTLESGFDVAVMAPTEILAEQLWQNFRKWFVPLGITVSLRTGSRQERAVPQSAAGFQPAEMQRQTGAALVLKGGEQVGPGFRRQDAGGTLTDPFFDRSATKDSHSDWLPHWRQADKLYYVTFRLADSVAQPVLQRWQHERDLWLKLHPEPWDGDATAEYHRRFTQKMEDLLDAGAGECWLAQPDIGELAATALRHFDGDRYQLGDFVVMPNHVHALARPAPGHELAAILHSWKSYSAKEANKSLKRTGAFWRDEYFDHLVRSDRQLEWFQHYIRNNPVKSKLAAGKFHLGRGSFVWPGERAAGFQPAEAQRPTGGELILNGGEQVGPGFRRQDAGGTLGGGTLTVGTHALIEAGFKPDRLGLAIIDEQHKFGVAQREKLIRKGRRDDTAPHLLVMTATPIPRTLGLTLYGDLDVSVLDELPAGRGRIRTHVRAAEALPKVWAFIRGELEKGRQAYVVYPRVEESEDDVKAVTVEFQKICRELAPHRGGLLHGRRPSEEKEAVMDSFRRGDIRILVATSVIEVGVDVPNATIMLIENAEQFGLAQLHQLRGRIGRGAHDSHCILVAEQKTDEARERLDVMAKTNDGFVLAEADLKLRGPGELTGRNQSGLPDFRFGDLVSDRQLVELAREVVRRHLRLGP